MGAGAPLLRLLLPKELHPRIPRHAQENARGSQATSPGEALGGICVGCVVREITQGVTDHGVLLAPPGHECLPRWPVGSTRHQHDAAACPSFIWHSLFALRKRRPDELTGGSPFP